MMLIQRDLLDKVIKNIWNEFLRKQFFAVFNR